jgi:hypothetical protein
VSVSGSAVTQGGRSQPRALVDADRVRLARTVERVARALIALGPPPTGTPPAQWYSDKRIEDATRAMSPSEGAVRRQTFTRNPEVAEIVARARALPPPVWPDFGAPLRLPVQPYTDASRRRRALRTWTRARLAEHCVALEGLIRHLEARRIGLMEHDFAAGPWPEQLPYPNEPYQSGAAAVNRYHHLRTRGRVAALACLVIDLEQRAMTAQAHVKALDGMYVEAMMEQRAQ